MDLIARARRRPVLVIVALVTVAAAIGMSVSGIAFLTRPIPFPDQLAGLWMAFNWVMACTALFFVYRNLHRFEEHWTWQEMGFSRGTFLLVFAASLGYFARIFDNPSVTLGTPVFTLGILWTLWASIRPPVRFSEDSDGSPS